MLWQMPQQRSQMLKWKFADWRNLLRLAASHALTLLSSRKPDALSTTSPPNLPLAGAKGQTHFKTSVMSGLFQKGATTLLQFL
jgi:hypothetical protein